MTNFDGKRGHPSRLIIGRHSYGIENIRITTNNEGADLYIGSFCSIAANQLIFLGGNHRTDWITTYPFGHIKQHEFPNGAVNGLGGHPCTKGDVYIGHDVWIGEGCTILSGVSIGSGSVVAAGSVVTKSMPSYTICGGNPANALRSRFTEATIKKLTSLCWWNYPDDVINLIVPLLQSGPCDEAFAQIESLLLDFTPS